MQYPHAIVLLLSESQKLRFLYKCTLEQRVKSAFRCNIVDVLMISPIITSK